MLFDDFEEDDDDDKDSAPAAEPREGLQSPRLSSLCLGHDMIEAALMPQIASGRIPHAMIFAGPEGIGKATFAYRLARYILARGTGGDEADSGGGLFGEILPPPPPPTTLDIPADNLDFQRIAAASHSDMLVVERQYDEDRQRYKGAVDVDSVRRIGPFMSLKASQGGWRVVIVDDADTMTEEAQNAILKILEEPPAKALLILVTHRPGRLLPTIRSRCRFMRFDPPNMTDFSRLMRENHPDLTTRELETLYGITDGSVGRSLRLTGEGGLEAVTNVISLMHDWPAWNWTQIHTLAEVMSKPGQDDTLDAFRQVMQWMADSILQAKARGAALTGPLDNEALNRMLAHNSLARWLEMADGLRTHFETAQRANLDRRHAVMGAFSVLSASA
jgi:DNA polymerase-3 subunit delta'